MPSPTNDPPVECPLRRAWGFPGRMGAQLEAGITITDWLHRACYGNNQEALPL